MENCGLLHHLSERERERETQSQSTEREQQSVSLPTLCFFFSFFLENFLFSVCVTLKKYYDTQNSVSTGTCCKSSPPNNMYFVSE